MLDGYYTLKNRMDVMLRRWSPEGAVHAAQVDLVSPYLAPVSARGGWRVWVFMGLVAGVLSGCVVLYLSSRTTPLPEIPMVGSMTGSVVDLEETTELTNLRKELVNQREQLQQLSKDHTAALVLLDQAKEQLSKERTRNTSLKAQLGVLQGKLQLTQKHEAELQESRPKLLMEAQRLKGVQSLLTSKETELDRVRRQLQTTRETSTLQESKTTAAAQEITRYRKLYEEGLKDNRKLESELVLMKVHRGAMMSHFQQMYLGLVKQGEGKALLFAARDNASAMLGARAELLRRTRLTERCARIRERVRDESTGKLLDRLEAVLTHLELLNTNDSRASRSFSSTLRETGLLGEIDKAMAKGGEDVAVRSLLFEAMMILKGAERAN